MDTVYQSREVAFRAPTMKEIIAIIPVMDDLVSNYRTYKKWIREIHEEKKEDKSLQSYTNSMNRVKNQLSILKEMGFYTSNGNTDIEDNEED